MVIFVLWFVQNFRHLYLISTLHDITVLGRISWIKTLKIVCVLSYSLRPKLKLWNSKGSSLPIQLLTYLLMILCHFHNFTHNINYIFVLIQFYKIELVVF